MRNIVKWQTVVTFSVSTFGSKQCCTRFSDKYDPYSEYDMHKAIDKGIDSYDRMPQFYFVP